MATTSNPGDARLEAILEKLSLLERRVRIIEGEIGIKTLYRGEEVENRNLGTAGRKDAKEKRGLESGFGESGLAWIGNIVLIFGIIFLMQYVQNKGQALLAEIIGYLLVSGIFMLAWFMRKTYATLSGTFNFSAMVLLFYVTLRLHFFDTVPLLSQEWPAILLLLAVVAFNFVFALRRKSVFITGLAFVMLAATAIVSDSTHVMLALLLAASGIAVYLHLRYAWWRLLVFSILLVYTAFLLWFIGNPVMGNPAGFIQSHQYGFVYLFAIGVIYSLTAIDFNKEKLSEGISLIAVIFNGFFFSLLLSLFVITFFKTENAYLFTFIALFCLAFASYLKSRSHWKLIPAFYALYGFLALSLTVYDIYGFPRVFWLLSLQSLLVLGMALWFRNKVIVMMNTVLFIMLFLVYLGISEPLNSVNISFAIVALATARILNWKKALLEIKTEYLRNIYLVAAFFMGLFALYHSIPAKFVTLSWTLLAIFYFVMSIALKNPKYRILALGTLLATALHLFIVDLARIEIVFRVIAFMFLAVMSIIISVYYARRQRDHKQESERAQD